MAESSHGPSLPRYARMAGLAYLVIIVTGIYAEFFVRGSLVVPGDPTGTAGNIMASEVLFRSSLGSEFIMLTADLFLALALYVLFRPVNRAVALLAAFFRVAHASIVAVNLLNIQVPLLLLERADYLSSFDPDQLHALSLLFLEAHGFGYAIGLVFFGVHCLLLGYLVMRSGYAPRILGVLLVVAGTGYLIDSFARALLPDYQAVEALLTGVVFTPAFVGEISFALWLLVKGVKGTEPGLAPTPAPSV